MIFLTNFFIQSAKNLFLLLSLLAIVTSAAETEGSTNHPRLTDIPNLTSSELNSINGKIVLVDIWASWCEPCKESLPYYEKLTSDKLAVIAVSEDSETKVAEEFLAKNKINLKVKFDSSKTLMAKWDIEAIPVLLLFDQTGGFVKAIRGFSTKSKADLTATIKKLMNRSPSKM